MKRLCAAAAAILLLAGCGAPQEEPPAAETTPTEVVETVPEAQTPVEEIPVELNPELPACEDGAVPEGQEAACDLELIEGLIEDSVGYTIEKPVFRDLNGADKINSFYETIVLDLENFCKSQIYDNAMNKSAVASAYGTMDFATVYDDFLEVQYRFRVEYSDDTENEQVRNDRFDLETGEKIKN